MLKLKKPIYLKANKMQNIFNRTALLIGENGVEKLNNSHVAVFGLGGVGSYVVEGLIRGGIENITLIDNDVYKETNINRQLYATKSTINKLKVDATEERILDINDKVKVNKINKFVLAGEIDDIDFSKFDYVVDAIDTITAKLEIIKKCKKLGVPIISSMGTGNKMDATCFKVSDIKNTKVCPLCKVMRKLLKENGIDSLKVVYSEEQPIDINYPEDAEKKGNNYAPSSISFVPSVAGLIISGEVIKDLIK